METTIPENCDVYPQKKSKPYPKAFAYISTMFNSYPKFP